MTDAQIRRALISVSDKTGLVEFARALAERGVELLSTGGTAKALQAAGLPVKDVAEHTGFPEMMDGRVKTLHPKVHGGLLAIRGNAEHDAAASAHGIAPIDLLVVNLYPFEATVAKGAPYDECIENIDIGGPAMIRAAAKNHAAVTVVVEPEDYARVLAELAANDGATTPRPAQGAGRQGLRAHGGLRRGDLRLVRRRAGRAARRAGARSAGGWRRSCATARTRISRRPSTSSGERAPGRRHRRAAAGQGAVLQQPQRHRRRLRAGRRVRPEGGAGRRHHQARQPVRRRASAPRSPRPTPRRCAAIRSAPSAASSRSTGPIDAATAREITEHLHRGGDRARRRATRPRRIFAAKKNLRLLTTGGLPDPRAPGPDLPLAGRRLPGAVARQRRRRRRELKVVTKRAPTRSRAGRPAVRLQGRQARQVERHRLRQGRRHGRHRRRPDEPRRQRPHRRAGSRWRPPRPPA